MQGEVHPEGSGSQTAKSPPFDGEITQAPLGPWFIISSVCSLINDSYVNRHIPIPLLPITVATAQQHPPSPWAGLWALQPCWEQLFACSLCSHTMSSCRACVMRSPDSSNPALDPRPPPSQQLWRQGAGKQQRGGDWAWLPSAPAGAWPGRAEPRKASKDEHWLRASWRGPARRAAMLQKPKLGSHGAEGQMGQGQPPSLGCGVGQGWGGAVGA